MGQDNDKTASIVLLIILIGALLSTVLYFKAETGRLDISQIDASVAFVQGGTELLVKPQLENTKKSDSGSISLGIEVEELRSNQILGQGNTSLGYVKAKSTQTANVYIPMEGEVSGPYRIKITLFEDGERLLSRSANINIPEPKPVLVHEESDLKFIDMGVIVTKISNESALIKLWPGVKNDGGTSGVITVNLKLTDVDNDHSVDQYGDNLGIIVGGGTEIGKVSFTAKDNRSYHVSIEVFEEGRVAIKGNVVHPLDLNATEKGKLLNLQILQEGIPPVTFPTPAPGTEVGVYYEKPTAEDAGTPGFEIIASITGLIAVAYILRRKND